MSLGNWKFSTPLYSYFDTIAVDVEQIVIKQHLAVFCSKLTLPNFLSLRKWKLSAQSRLVTDSLLCSHRGQKVGVPWVIRPGSHVHSQGDRVPWVSARAELHDMEEGQVPRRVSRVGRACHFRNGESILSSLPPLTSEVEHFFWINSLIQSLWWVEKKWWG